MEYCKYVQKEFESQLCSFNSILSEFDVLCSFTFSAIDFNLYMPKIETKDQSYLTYSKGRHILLE